jgi:hypothetical protein
MRDEDESGADRRRDATVVPRIGRAAAAFGIAWVVTSGVWIAWIAPWTEPRPGAGWSDTLGFLLIVGGFAALGWVFVVVPLVVWVAPRSWLFARRTAWIVGAASGVAILLAEYAAFFQLYPPEVLREVGDPGVGMMLATAGIFGGVLWAVFCSRSSARGGSA